MLDLKNVLALEDEPIIAFTLEDVLVALGCEQVSICTQVEQALELVQADAVDGAILDVNVRGERSYVVASELQRRSVPFIFATGYGEAEHPAEFASVPTVTKPYTEASIENALKRAARSL